MTGSESFQDILEEKMGTAEAVAAPSSPRTAEGVDPAHLAFLLGEVGISRFKTAPKMSRFGVKPPTARAPRPRLAGPAHILDERQKTALAWFHDAGEALLPDFKSEELKAAFRRLARQLHPDVGGTDELFLRLKGHHSALARLTK